MYDGCVSPLNEVGYYFVFLQSTFAMLPSIMYPMNPIVLLNKPLSLTPLQMIKKLQILKPEYIGMKIGYAGRLDPMAEGLLLLLVGDENKHRKEYERLDKTYEFEVLLGLETDSYDVLGLIQQDINATQLQDVRKTVKSLLETYIGTWEQPYPPYSAARVNGKPLYYWAREGKIDQITIPSKKITIHSIKLNNIFKVNLADIYPEIVSRIQTVEGEFRQKQILSCWKAVFTNNPDCKLIKLPCTVSCSSGTYVRSISHSIGTDLGVGGIALSIKRTVVGPYTLQTAIHL